jgi:hypothetical protein
MRSRAHAATFAFAGTVTETLLGALTTRFGPRAFFTDHAGIDAAKTSDRSSYERWYAAPPCSPSSADSGSPLEARSPERMLGMVVELVGHDVHLYAVIPMLCALVTPPSGKAIDPRIDDVLD